MEENKKRNFISLAEAAKLCSYSEPYLRLRARGGKLKSIKLGKKWMTTAAWLDDYEIRVQEWREAGEAKKAAQSAAVLVSAPAELSGNLEQNGALRQEPRAASEIKAVLPDTVELKPATAVFCGRNAEILPPPIPKRFRAMTPSGQIYPAPKKEQLEIGDISDYSWLGALFSGAAVALLLFLAFNQGGISAIENADYGLGQANVSRAALAGQASNSIFPDTSEMFSAADPLKELVAAVARYFKGY